MAQTNFPSHYFANGDIFNVHGATVTLRVDQTHPGGGLIFDAYMEDALQPVDSIEITIGITVAMPEEKVLRFLTFSEQLVPGAHVTVGRVPSDLSVLRTVRIKTLKTVDEKESRSDHFANGDVFNVYGATVTLRVDRAQPDGGLDAYMEDALQPVDSIEITVGREVAMVKGTILRFQTFAEKLVPAAHVLVGTFPEPEDIHIVRIKTMKTVDEQEYR
jgi:hypothetical protein